MSDISKIKVSSVEYNIKDIQAREDLGNLGTRVTELEQHGGGGSVPKPLTYDYMPAGYPSKSVQTVAVMGEQEVAFADDKGNPPYFGSPAGTFEIVEGQTYTVNWDGTAYVCVCVLSHSRPVLGNLSVVGAGDDTGEPFFFDATDGMFITLNTSEIHTISVKTAEEVITPMAVEFLPAGGSGAGQFIVVVYNTNVAGTEFAADKTYDEISAAVESGMSVVIHRKTNINAANYDVFHHNQTGSGFYRFCRVKYGKTIEVQTIGIRMVNGEMVIDIQSKEIQAVTS